MKTRKIISSFIFVLIFVFCINIITTAAATKPLVINGKNLKYRGTNINVTIPTEYIRPDADFRGIWVTPIVGGNLARFINEEQYKGEIRYVLDIMEYYNLNALIFHVRPFNDAFYESKLNPWSRYLVGFDVDPGWDPLPWIIEETHKRGIEFHAWLNPYRITNSGATSARTVASRYPSANAASNPDNILVYDGRAILNPGEPAVREFLIDTVMEIIENYDVDAIHFDDYFYINGINDSATRNKYNPNNLSVADWRREQVDIFIRDLSRTMRSYNIANNRYVQLGISPTGIYKNGGSGFAYGGPDKYDANGNFITNGSNTAGQEHYASYLYSNTKKWVDNEWIDYIIPQTYWALTHNVAGYADVVDWWAKVVKHKKVNLYTGMGIYMAQSGGNYSWGTNPEEAPMQVLYNTKHKEVQGTSIFSYTDLKNAYTNKGKPNVNAGLAAVQKDYWDKPSLMPELRTYDSVKLERVTNFKAQFFNDIFELSWQSDPKAFKYAIYRSPVNNFSNDDLIAVIGNNAKDGYVTFTDKEATGNQYYYKVIPISRTNTLGEEQISKVDRTDLNEIGDITGIVIPEGYYPWENVPIRFNKLDTLHEINYSVEISNDLETWTSIDEDMIDEGDYFTLEKKQGFPGKEHFIRITASSEAGMSRRVMKIIYKELTNIPPITRFRVSGPQSGGSILNIFADQYIDTFHDDVSYELEYSFDDKEFFKANIGYRLENKRVYFEFNLPFTSSINFRINIINNKLGESIIGRSQQVIIFKTNILATMTKNAYNNHQNRIHSILK